MLKKILITGGAGFIGSNLIELLLDKNMDITVIDNFSTGKKENLLPFISDINIIEGNILNLSLLKKTLKNIDAVVHLAAIPSVIQSIKNPIKVSHNNILGTISLFDIIAKTSGVSRIVQASSSAIYGESEVLPISEKEKINPLSPYAIDKVAQELYGYFFSNKYNLEIISLRFFNVFGPKQDPKSFYAGVIPIFINKFKNNQSPIIFGNGKSIRDFVFINDITIGIYKSLITNLNKHVILNLGTGIGTSITDLAKLLASLMYKKNNIIYKSKRPGEIINSLADINKAKKILNFNPKYSLKEGLTSLLESINNI